MDELIQRAIEGIDAAVVFGEAQLPEVIRQLLLWEALTSGALFALGLLGFVTSAVLVCGGIKALKVARSEWALAASERSAAAADKDREEYLAACEACNAATEAEGLATARLFFGIAGVIASTVLTLTNATWLQILIAPKYYLLEYARSLI